MGGLIRKIAKIKPKIPNYYEMYKLQSLNLQKTVTQGRYIIIARDKEYKKLFHNNSFLITE